MPTQKTPTKKIWYEYIYCYNPVYLCLEHNLDQDKKINPLNTLNTTNKSVQYFCYSLLQALWICIIELRTFIFIKTPLCVRPVHLTAALCWSTWHFLFSFIPIVFYTLCFISSLTDLYIKQTPVISLLRPHFISFQLMWVDVQWMLCSC